MQIAQAASNYFQPMKQSEVIAKGLPYIETLRRLTKSLAMLDAIISPEWDYRYYSYNANWGRSEEMASMRDGSGDEWFLLFHSHGAALKGFAHELSNAYGGDFAKRIRQTVPSEFTSFLNEPSFGMDLATFCLWRLRTDGNWSVVTDGDGTGPIVDDGSAELLELLDGQPETYRAWAADYFEREIDLSAIRMIYSHQTLDESLVKTLNPDLSLMDVLADAKEIGYPV